MKRRYSPDLQLLQRLRAGLLQPFLDDYAQLLVQKGYCHCIGKSKLELVADLGCWMTRRHVELKVLHKQHTDAFLKARRKRVRPKIGDQATLTLLLRHLREASVIPAPALGRSPIDLVAQDYERFLLHERSLAPTSAGQYLHVTRRFLSHRFGRGKVQLKKLCAKDVTGFVLQDTAGRGRRSAQLMTTVLRSFLGFLFQRGRIVTHLAMSVPTVAGWRLSELPRFLEVAEVEKVLRCCDRRRKVGKRDYAILLLLARLGLRAGEVAGLTLEDIDWDAGELRIRGKGSRLDRLPLPKDVGEAMADYLQKGRPACLSRRVFVQSKAPYDGFATPPNAVCSIVRTALTRAQLNPPHRGAHLLRHSLATRMLGHGASLAQIGQVLRHQQIQSTEIYAKVNMDALRALAHVWPGGAR
jgi:site-specific recombinase XerD